MNHKVLTLNDAVPKPSGSDITGTAGDALVAADFAIRANRSAVYLIPFVVAGYRDILIGLSSITQFDQQFTISISGMFDASGNGPSASLASVTLTSGTAARFTFGARATGQGGVVGGENVANVAHYAIPALAEPFPYIAVSVSTGATPTAGKFILTVARS